MLCDKKLLNISYKGHVLPTRRISAISKEPLENIISSYMTLFKKRKLRRFGRLSMSFGLVKGTVRGKRRKREKTIAKSGHE